MNDWAEASLGSLVAFQKGRKVDTATVRLPGYERYLGASGILGFQDGFAATSGAVQATKSDVLMLWDGERSGLVGHGEVGVVASTVSRLTPRDDVDSKFLYYSLAHQFEWIQNRRTGSGVPHVPKEIGRILRVRYPRSLDRQRRIAQILECIDAAIGATEALIAKHQQIKAGLMHDLFTRGVLPSGKLRSAPRDDPDDYQISTLGPLPHGWRVLPLRGCLAVGASNGIYKPPHLIGSGLLLVGQSALTADRSVDLALGRRATVSMQDLRRFGLTAGDILIARVFATVEGVGRPALVPELDEPAVFESNMMRLRVDAATIRPRLLFEWLKGTVSRRHIEGHANASNQVSVNQGVLYPLLVPVPPLDEQNQILARIESADERRIADLATLFKLRTQKLGLMQDLLTGKVRVPMPDPEVTA